MSFRSSLLFALLYTGCSSNNASSGALGSDGGGTFPLPNCRPTPIQTGADPHRECVDRINQFRSECQNLPPLARWQEGEACADQMAQYDASKTGAHAGFVAGICNGGSAQNECPNWPSPSAIVSSCLQQMWDEGPGASFQEHGHYINMSSTQYSRVACGFYTTSSGKIWSVQNFQ